MSSVETDQFSIIDREYLETLRSATGSNCVPSLTSIEELQASDLILLSGQFVGAGKSTLAKDLEGQGRVYIPSWTNRDLRPGEVEGVDKITGTLSTMAHKAVSGYFLELEEVRPGMFYATPAEFNPGKAYVKDLELKGALRLRSFAPELPIIIPVPPTGEASAKQVSEWERRVVEREGFNKRINDKDKTFSELQGRMEGVIEEADRIEELDLYNDPNTLLVVNNTLPEAIAAMNLFLTTGEKTVQPGIEKHIAQLKNLAQTALDQL